MRSAQTGSVSGRTLGPLSAVKHPTKTKNQTGNVQQPKQTQVSMQWSGPLPPPAALEHFERIIPGGADRILKMVEQEQAHRFDVEQKCTKASVSAHTRGQLLGAVLCLAAIVAAVANSQLGGPWQVSVALVSVPVLGVAQALIRGRRPPPE